MDSTIVSKMEEEYTHHDALSPILRLGPDILSTLFMLLRDTAERPDSDYDYNPGTLDWIKSVSHICRKWREVALGDARLWNCIIFTKLKFRDEMLTRTKGTPLVIKVNMGLVSIDVVALALKEIKRIRELNIKASRSVIQNILDSIVFDSEHSPSLESLSLAESAGDTSGILSIHTRGTDTIRLRRLDLHGIVIPIGSPLFVGLTALTLRPPLPRSMRTTELLYLLGKIPNLEILYLENCVCNTTTESTLPASENQCIVKLPRLSSISFDGTFEHEHKSTISEFLKALKYISYPPSADLRIMGIYPEAEVHLLLEALYTPHVRRLYLGAVEGKPGGKTEGVHLYLSGDINCHPPSSTINMSLQWRLNALKMVGAPKPHPTTHLLQKLPLSELHTIRLEKKLPLPSIWIPVLGNLKQVRCIYTQALDIVGVLASPLERKLDTNPEDENRPKMNFNSLHFPALEHLVFEKICFKVHVTNESIIDDFGKLWGRLYGRLKVGAPIKHVSFFRCEGIADKEYESLRAIGIHVEN